MPTAASLIDYINEQYEPDAVIAYSVWNINDILPDEEDSEHDVKGAQSLTEDDAREILDRVHRRQDASIGINWEVIATHVSEFIADRDRDKVKR
jgi:hypothetical protein